VAVRQYNHRIRSRNNHRTRSRNGLHPTAATKAKVAGSANKSPN
jgi:hypothetical protein